MKKLVADKVTKLLGGHLRIAVSGGAALSPEISKTFIGLGINILQGYGLTETSPVISVNRTDNNHPSSVGLPIEGVKVRLGIQNSIEVKGPNVMLGYWNNPEATSQIFTEDKWLNTGDVGKFDAEGRIYIVGRIKEIIVLSNGEKIPPNDIEAAILNDPLFEQVMVLGEGKPYLSLLAVVNRELWQLSAEDRSLDKNWPLNLSQQQSRAFALSRVAKQIKAFPGYAKVRRIALMSEPWTIENNLLTPTLKLKRDFVTEKYKHVIDELYEGYNS